MIRRHPWIAPFACAVIAIAVPCWWFLSNVRLSEKMVSAAQNEVYEAVVRDIVRSPHGQTNMSELVFDDALLTERMPGEDIHACTERARKELRLDQNTRPQYDSLADKIYRAFAHGSYDSSLRADTIQDFFE